MSYICTDEHLTALSVAIIITDSAPKQLQITAPDPLYIYGPNPSPQYYEARLDACKLVFDELEIENWLSSSWRSTTRRAEKRDPLTSGFNTIMAKEMGLTAPRFQVSDLPALALIKATHNYQQRASNHPAWNRSNAAEMTTALIIKLLKHVPGYLDAKWDDWASYKARSD